MSGLHVTKSAKRYAFVLSLSFVWCLAVSSAGFGSEVIISGEARLHEGLGCALAQSSTDRALIIVGDLRWDDAEAIPWVPPIVIQKETHQDALAAWCAQAHLVVSHTDEQRGITVTRSGIAKSITEIVLGEECAVSSVEQSLIDCFPEERLAIFSKASKRKIEIEIGAAPRSRIFLVPSGVPIAQFPDFI